MKKQIFSILTALMLFSSLVSAQNEPTQKEDWQTFQPKGEEFTVTTPISLKLYVPDKNVNNRQFTAAINGRFFFISSDTLENPVHYKTIQGFLKTIPFKSQKEKINSFQVEKFSIDYSDDFFHNLWIIKSNSRVYIFHTASEIENDQIINRFLRSVKIDRNLTGENEKTDLVYREGTGISGSDYGSSNSSVPTKLPTPIDTNNSPLKILSKPRAYYTDVAHFFDIQGSVRLRVTFLSTGEIGAVEAVKKLPFGLTANSIEAARKMRFGPMRKDGTAINASKLVEYTFTIY